MLKGTFFKFVLINNPTFTSILSHYNSVSLITGLTYVGSCLFNVLH